MKLTRISKALLGSLVFLGMAGAANAALIVQPSTPGLITGSQDSCDKSCVEAVFGAINITLLYQATNGGGESGTHSGSYNTDFWNSDRNALVDYDGGSAGSINCGNCYLVVRREDHDGYYFYNLGLYADWNGTENLEWRGSRDIDRVQIYGGGSKVKVPEPTTLSLFGLGLLALGFGVRRKRD
jgi:hypothetical protein